MKFALQIWKSILKIRLQLDSFRLLNVAVQRTYLESFPYPKNDLERSFYQYKCQCYVSSKIEFLFLKIAAVAALPIYFCILRNRSKKKTDFIVDYDAVYIQSGLGKSLIPNSLKKEFENIIEIVFKENMFLDKEACLFFLKSLKKHPFSFYFNLKNMMNIAIYCSAIKRYHPKAIISYSEWSFGSSLCTSYCNSCGVQLINVLHGEKLYHIRDSFFRYNRFYVWDEHYVNLFKSLRADPEQFIVEVPLSICLNLPLFDENLPEAVEFKFYLEIEDREKLKRLKDVIDILLANGIKLKIRPHPRATDIKIFADFFQGEIVEDPMQITFEQSLATTKNAVARYSTVLNQAFHSGRGVVIDDISDPITYEKLFEVNYIMLEKKHRLLSELIN